MKSYAADPGREILGVKVTNVKNFETDEIRDIEGDLIPKTKMLTFDLEDGTRIAVRHSGTEPKIKYYLFARRQPKNHQFAEKDLEQVKLKVAKHLDELWDWLRKDAESRLTKPSAAITRS
jgi:phosphoglucomutase